MVALIEPAPQTTEIVTNGAALAISHDTDSIDLHFAGQLLPGITRQELAALRALVNHPQVAGLVEARP